MDDIDSVRLELLAERHSRRKDNEYLLERLREYERIHGAYERMHDAYGLREVARAVLAARGIDDETLAIGEPGRGTHPSTGSGEGVTETSASPLPNSLGVPDD